MNPSYNKLYWFKEDPKLNQTIGEYYALERYTDFSKLLGHVSYPTEHSMPHARVYFGPLDMIHSFPTIDECKQYVEDQYQLYVLKNL